jgi:hypothetical protein
MQLGQYLRENKITLREFALRIGAANASVVQKWVAGHQRPRGKFMAAIARETGGKVQPRDFYDLQDA